MSKQPKKQVPAQTPAQVEATPAQVEAMAAVIEAVTQTPAVSKPKAKRYASIAVLANPNAVIAYLAPIEATRKKPGTLTYRKYSLFQQGLTVAQVEAKFVENNWPRMKARNQLRWDIEHGFVALEVPAPAATEA